MWYILRTEPNWPWLLHKGETDMKEGLGELVSLITGSSLRSLGVPYLASRSFSGVWEFLCNGHLSPPPGLLLRDCVIDAGPAPGWCFSGWVLEVAPIFACSLRILAVDAGPVPWVWPLQCPENSFAWSMLKSPFADSGPNQKIFNSQSNTWSRFKVSFP